MNLFLHILNTKTPTIMVGIVIGVRMSFCPGQLTVRI